MSIEGNTVKVTTLSPEEMEKILSDKYGSKLSPVDKKKLAEKRQKQAVYRAKTEAKNK